MGMELRWFRRHRDAQLRDGRHVQRHPDGDRQPGSDRHLERNDHGDGSGPTATPPPSCPTVDFTWTDRHNNGNPHRMDLNATLTPNSSGWTWAWVGPMTFVGQANRPSVTVDFAASGNQQVAVTATKGSCNVTITKTVPAP
jgi:hypothetical protein